MPNYSGARQECSVVISYEGWYCRSSSALTCKLNIKIKDNIVLMQSSRYFGGILTIWAPGRFTVQIKSICGTSEQPLRVKSFKIELMFRLLIQHGDDTALCTLEMEMAEYQAGCVGGGGGGVCLSDLSRCKCPATIRPSFLSPHASVNVNLFLLPCSLFSFFVAPSLPPSNCSLSSMPPFL